FKTYQATLVLGVTTDTYDLTGKVLARSEATLDEATVRETAHAFVGAIDQRAPAVSAIKQGGEPLHRRVRRGEDVEPPVRRVLVESLAIDRIEPESRSVTFTVVCSSGTYVRSLAHDWGQALGAGAALSSLRRLAIGPHRVEGAIPTDDLLERPIGSIPEWNERLADAGMTPEGALAFLPALELDEAEAHSLSLGRAPSVRRALDAGLSPGAPSLRLVSATGRLLGVGALPEDASSVSVLDRPLEIRIVWAAAAERGTPAGAPS
ncbi:MAG: hypothetical protein ACREOU_15470, partial [Candidatus Eiseniibacteriota bacterium]